MSHFEVLDVPQLVASNEVMAAKIQAKFYCDADLWAAAQRVMSENGYKYSEGCSRMLALLVMLPEGKRAEMFKVPPAKAIDMLQTTPARPSSTSAKSSVHPPLKGGRRPAVP